MGLVEWWISVQLACGRDKNGYPSLADHVVSEPVAVTAGLLRATRFISACMYTYLSSRTEMNMPAHTHARTPASGLVAAPETASRR